jgi:hypothetical protein
MNQDDQTDNDISDDESEDHRESTLSYEIGEDNSDHQQVFHYQGQAWWDTS